MNDARSSRLFHVFFWSNGTAWSSIWDPCRDKAGTLAGSFPDRREHSGNAGLIPFDF
jgi:hypothetical protein